MKKNSHSREIIQQPTLTDSEISKRPASLDILDMPDWSLIPIPISFF